MNNTDAIEQAYRNGYEDGKRDAVRHGEWIEYYKGTYGSDYKCSECGNRADEDNAGHFAILTDYCSNCGAKMDGEIHDKISQDE